jgi:O-acetyl-ADP-ribose deacetylase (regulator of RNase III)
MITLVKGDITAERVDIIVTAANSELVGGGGVDGAVHRACGPKLLQAIRELGSCPTGSAVMTRAFDLEPHGVKHIIHAVGPIYRDGKSSEPELLSAAYMMSMKLAHSVQARSIAFPAISAGVYGYPLAEAASIAVTTVGRALQDYAIEARFVLFSDNVLAAFEKALAEGGSAIS